MTSIPNPSPYSIHLSVKEYDIQCIAREIKLAPKSHAQFKKGIWNILEEAEVLLDLSNDMDGEVHKIFDARNRQEQSNLRERLQKAQNAIERAQEAVEQCSGFIETLFLSSDTSFLIAALSSSPAARKLGLGTDLNGADRRAEDIEGIQFHLNKYADRAESLAPQDLQFSKVPGQSLASILSMISNQLTSDLNSFPVSRGRNRDLARDRLLGLIYDLFEDTFGKPPSIRDDGAFVDLCTGIFHLIGSASLPCNWSMPDGWDELSGSTIKNYVKKRRREQTN